MEQQQTQQPNLGADRAQRAKQRQQSKGGGSSGKQQQQAGWQPPPNWKPPEFDQQSFAAGIRVILDGVHGRLVEELKERAKTQAQKTATEAFAKECLSNDMEVMLLSSGVQLMASKYGAVLAGQYMPEITLGCGVLAFAVNQMRLRRMAKEIAESWEKSNDSKPAT